MTIPALNKNGELPEGEHFATLDEIEMRYGRSSKSRIQLMTGLREAVERLVQAGVRKIWVNGSFITGKENPNDIDGCWEYNRDVDETALLDDFLSIQSRDIVKERYGLDFFIAQWVEGISGKPFPKFFQVNRDGEAKGIVVVEIGE